MDGWTDIQKGKHSKMLMAECRGWVCECSLKFFQLMLYYFFFLIFHDKMLWGEKGRREPPPPSVNSQRALTPAPCGWARNLLCFPTVDGHPSSSLLPGPPWLPSAENSALRGEWLTHTELPLKPFLFILSPNSSYPPRDNLLSIPLVSQKTPLTKRQETKQCRESSKHACQSLRNKF